MSNIYDQLSEERKALQAKGDVPEWYTTAGWQLFKDKYLYGTDSVRGQFERIAKTAAKHLVGTKFEEQAEAKFFELFWKGWLSPSTPVLSNMGTSRGLPVACSGNVVGDSVYDFYTAYREVAMLTKYGFGTSGYLGNIRPRGTPISSGGKASGVQPVFEGYIEDMQKVSQGNTRRGSYAGYLPIDHGDFDEVIDFVYNNPDDANIGWNISTDFVNRLNKGDTDAVRRFQKSLKTKMVVGKGYYSFPDKVNARRPEAYVKNNLYFQASNLCNEITLFSDEEHTFTCVLSSMNVSLYDEWKDTDAVYWATIFLDCVASEFLAMARDIPGLENAVRFTEKGRALGLGQCGFHTYLQNKLIPFESIQAHIFNIALAKSINEKSLAASKDMAVELGEPLWCQGLGIRNTHRIAIAPTKSTALLMGGVSEGINPDPAMIYTQTTAGGEMHRINPVLLRLMKERGHYNKKTIDRINQAMGSVQAEMWLTSEERLVLKTAFEINQEVVLRMAAGRGKYCDQWQSLNMFFGEQEDPEWVSHCHKLAFEDPDILGLYYITTRPGVVGSKECEACM